MPRNQQLTTKMGDLHGQSSLRNQLRTIYLVFKAWEGGLHKSQPVNPALILNIPEYIIKGYLLKLIKVLKILGQDYLWKPQETYLVDRLGGVSWSQVGVNKEENSGAGIDITRWIWNWMTLHIHSINFQWLAVLSK